MNPGLREHERIDELGRKGFRIIQNTKTFCFGIDAVLLAEFVKAGPRDRVADLGSGNGILPMLLIGRDKGGSFAALEIQQEMADLARRNMDLNGLQDMVEVVEGDLKEASRLLGKNRFDLVVVNPPYIKAGSGLLNPGEAKAIARHEILCKLEDVLREGAALLKEGGGLFMIHRCWRMGEVLAALESHGLKARRIRLVHSYADGPGELFLLEAKKGKAEGCQVEPPCVIFEAPGLLSPELYKACHGREREDLPT